MEESKVDLAGQEVDQGLTKNQKKKLREKKKKEEKRLQEEQ